MMSSMNKPINDPHTDIHDWMAKALQLAQQAKEAHEVPVGALVVLDHQIIGQGYNQMISSHDPCAHAEIIALRQAAQQQKNYRLTGAQLIVTLEPCLMCWHACIHARIDTIIYAAVDRKLGLFSQHKAKQLQTGVNHTLKAIAYQPNQAAQDLLIDFFHQRRQSGKHESDSTCE